MTSHRKPDEHHQPVLGQAARVFVIVWLSTLAAVVLITLIAAIWMPS